ncbi:MULTISPECIES: chorismate--pyruvate lyase family protein [Pseudoalteromonas]|uniref:Chorismate lyase n=1 Tax=Pseudoalteromonas obscura TaxID=3048491 RepID=A0ABT7ENC8_9GAMM|nr:MULTISPECIES: chorismate lyase [Pseudoalteromonas]MBQ4839139.1 chorismate lyase [Pseudoalteromonas luteoviolacea]MDK2596533.1 chorismate lyase [Pseudoalteromonas sp. P94(2023)]
MLKYPISLDFNWGSFEQVADKAPENIHDRLLEQGSLTALLKSQSSSFRVKVINEQHLTPPAYICRLLGDAMETAICREVLLYCDDKPHVYAQSWISLEANQYGLKNLGENPLGDKLFQQSSWQRGDLEVGCVEDADAQLKLWQLFGVTDIPVFARRSVFTNHSAKVLVCEMFNSEIE